MDIFLEEHLSPPRSPAPLPSPPLPPPSSQTTRRSASLSPSLWPSTKEPLSLGYWLPRRRLTATTPPPNLTGIPKFWSKWVGQQPASFGAKPELGISIPFSTGGSFVFDHQPKVFGFSLLKFQRVVFLPQSVSLVKNLNGQRVIV